MGDFILRMKQAGAVRVAVGSMAVVFEPEPPKPAHRDKHTHEDIQYMSA